MRKIKLPLIISALLFIGSQTMAQDHWCWTCNPATNGYVRIGVNAPFTTKQLYVRANSSDNVAYFENISPFGNGMIISAPEDPLRVGGLNDFTGQFFIIKKHPTIAGKAVIGINETSPNTSFSLDVGGSVQSFGFFTTSDERAKKNILPEMSDYLDIYKVKTYQYEYKEDQMNRSHYGVLAQEMTEIYPDMVVGSEEEGYSVNYTEMIPLLIRAVQDQKQTIDALQEELSELRSKLTDNQELAHVLNIEPDQMTIFPNPANGTAHVSLKGNVRGNVTLEVLNLNGEVVRQIKNNGGKTADIDTSGMLKGVYFVRYLRDGKIIETKRMLIEK